VTALLFPTFIIVAPKPARELDEIESLLKAEDRAIVHRARTPVETLETFRQIGRAVVLISVSEPAHLKMAVTLLALLNSESKAGIVRIAVITGLDHPDLDRVLKKNGCNDLIWTTVKARGVRVKLMRHWSLLERGKSGTAASIAAARASKGWKARSLAPVVEKVGTGDPPHVVESASLEMQEDYWIVRARAARKVRDHWIIKLLGPAPSAGRWIKSPTEAESWDWTPQKKEDNPFMVAGVWTFSGKQPEFRDALWTLMGEKPRLVYLESGGSERVRLHVDVNGNLVMARNSAAARRFMPAIKASLDNELRLKREKFSKGGNVTFEREPSNSPLLSCELDEELSSGFELGDLGKAEQDLFPPDYGVANPSNQPAFLDGSFGEKKSVAPGRIAFYRDVQPRLRSQSKLFVEINDAAECRIYMREAAELAQVATIWTPGQKFRTETAIREYRPSTGSLLLAYPQGMKETEFMSRIKRDGASELLVNANLNRGAIFFQQALSEIQASAKGFEIRSPGLLYEVQRRSHLRYVLLSHQSMPVKLARESSRFRVLMVKDISPGGMCLRIDPAADPRGLQLVKDEEIQKVSFKIYNREINCSGVIRWRTPGMAGLEFVGLSAYEAEGIKLFIMEENYEYLKRFVLLDK
jgi:hypothetical protein